MRKMAFVVSLVLLVVAPLLAHYWTAVAPILSSVPDWVWIGSCICLACVWWGIQWFSPLERVWRAAGYLDHSWEHHIDPLVKSEINRRGASPFIELFKAYDRYPSCQEIMRRLSEMMEVIHLYGLAPYTALAKNQRETYLMVMAGLSAMKARLHSAEAIEVYGNVLAEIFKHHPSDQSQQSIVSGMVPVVAQWSEGPKEFESSLRQVVSMPASIEMFGNLPRLVAQSGVSIEVLEEVEAVVRDTKLEKWSWARIDEVPVSRGIALSEPLTTVIKPYQHVETLLQGEHEIESRDGGVTSFVFPKSLSAAWGLIDRFGMETFDQLSDRVNSALCGVCLGLAAIQDEIGGPKDLLESTIWRRGLHSAWNRTREPYYEEHFVATHSGQGIDPSWDEYETILSDPDQEDRNAIKHAESILDQLFVRG